MNTGTTQLSSLGTSMLTLVLKEAIEAWEIQICRASSYSSCLATGPLYMFFRENIQTTTDYMIVDAVHASIVAEC